MAPNLTQLVLQRRVYELRVKETLQIAEKARSDSSYKNLLALYCDDLQENYDSFKLAHNNVISAIDDEGFEEQDAIRIEIDKSFYRTKFYYNQVFPPKEVTTVQPVSQNVPHNLPKIKLNSFNGQVQDWESFIELFNSLVHTNTSLTEVEKFHYLLTSVNGPALDIIKTLPLQAENYSVAYDILYNRYNNRRRLATQHYSKIFDAPVMTKGNALELRSILDVFTQNLAALEKLKFDVKSWDFILLNCLLSKLHLKVRSDFEIKYADTELPSYQQLYDFLEGQCKAAETLQVDSVYPKAKPNATFDANNKTNFKKSSFVASSDNHNSPYSCPLCSANHNLYNCSTFLEKSVQDRYNLVKEQRLCVNCLSRSHSIRACRSKLRCRKCSRSHHSLLHRFENTNASNTANSPANSGPGVSSEEPTASTSISVTSCNTSIRSQASTVLLSTAQLGLKNRHGKFTIVRALLDSGSQANFITQACVKRLGLQYKKSSIPIECLNNTALNNVQGITKCTAKPLDTANPVLEFEAIVLPQICSNQPQITFDPACWDHIKHLKLADPQVNVPGSIDLLLGAELLPMILGNNRLAGNKLEPIAIESIFGWVLQGRALCPRHSPTTALLSCHSSASLDECIKKFWEVESVANDSELSPEDAKCESLYTSSVTRTPTGRFCVSLPFRNEPPILGESRSQAMHRFINLENRLSQKPELWKEYGDFMKDYLDSNHMTAVKPQDYKPDNVYYIPHHCVLKPESLTTRLRVVFDASAKTTLGTSLNDQLLAGPKLQRDIFTILINFRKFPVVFTCDIRQMYRQILICNEHRDFQRILFRFSRSDPIQEFRLNTVTYGVTSAPYLALRTLQELTKMEGSCFSQAADAINTQIYVDDVVTGAENIESAIRLRDELISLFSLGGFELRKWTTNCQDILSGIDSEAQTHIEFDKEHPQFIKVLGLKWDPIRDVFSYSVKPSSQTCTKRSILSDIARIYDPLGFLTPVVLLAKHIVQQLWANNLGWDDCPSSSLCNQWVRFKDELPLLEHLEIPRFITGPNVATIALHGFCDASEIAYAAALYLRVEFTSGQFTSRLCCAKSKVAPLKKLSIPRLELLGAVLLTNLIEKLLRTSSYNFNSITAWTDSEIVLSWLSSHSSKWKTFIANRISLIHELLPASHWRHTPSQDNPADCASRGLFPSQLCDFVQWWTGPIWLVQPSSCWPQQPSMVVCPDLFSLEAKVSANLVAADVNAIINLLHQFSSLRKILGIVSYMLRFISGCKNNLSENPSFNLSSNELQTALLTLVKHVQQESFSVEIHSLRLGQTLAKPLRKLSLFIDDQQLVRVGGRLRHANLDYNAKHPLLLPNNHRLSDLIIQSTHDRNLHPGYKTLSYLLLQQFWIISPRRAIDRCLSRCYRCFKANPKFTTPPMADLPPCRINQIRAFRSVCLDYAGPFLVTLTRSRGCKATKAYICIFVCCAVKAIHLELASNLSSEAFIAAFQRFIARRGECLNIHSDQGTNFIGANKILHQLAEQASSQLRIKWHFNPPSAPHFNGLAEAGVKAVKTHLTRVLGNQILTYEEFYTLLTRIEAVLNSRPLCSVSSDPADLKPLTPGHFLTLEPLNSAVPDPDLAHLNVGRLNRWQLLQQMHQHFWKRWQKEYLNTLQQRAKWNRPVQALEVGTMVLIKADNQPTNNWALGRILHVHPGSDGVIRAVTLRTSNGILQRPVVKLCPLPNH